MKSATMGSAVLGILVYCIAHEPGNCEKQDSTEPETCNEDVLQVRWRKHDASDRDNRFKYTCLSFIVQLR
jgi:hypothetical protein